MIRFLLPLMMLGCPAAASAGDLVVTVTGVRDARGHVLVAVCDHRDFLAPTCPYSGRAKAHVGAVVIRVADVPAGIYAVEAYQDENDSNVLRRNFFGMPNDGLGFSRDAPMRFGPPSFADAAVSIRAAGGEISFGLRYYDR